MVTAVDTSVLLDVLLNDPQHAPASIAALRQAAAEGSLIICETTLAEVAPTLPSADVPQFLSDRKLGFVPSGRISTLPPTRLALRSADLRSGAFPRSLQHLPGRRPALRGQCQAAPVPSQRPVGRRDVPGLYLQRGGQRDRVVPDFLIAAHAQTHAQRLLARDRGYYRDYFTQLNLWNPTPAS